MGNRKKDYLSLKGEYDTLVAQSLKLGQENTELKKNLEANKALYDITRDICKSLKIDTLFRNFCEQLNKYIVLKDCLFLKEDADLSTYKDYLLLPLKINKSIAGYLAARGISNADDKDKFHILAGQFILGIKRAILYQRVQELAITDTLTGVFSRRHYLDRLEEEINYSQKLKQSFALLMLDIDYFKKYNDRYGHLVGDAILKELAATIKENLRQIDLIGRYGGEEFSIILSQTEKKGGIYVAGRIHQAVGERLFRAYDEDLRLTVTIGMSVFPDDATDSGGLIEKADAALYQAKRAGRNRLCVWGEKEKEEERQG